jgi:hypothetical protein
MSCLVVAAAVATAAAEDHACPMAAKAQQHQAAVDHRHEATTHVASAASRHHFRLADDGGSIRLEATSENDVETRDRVRTHLQAIARAFAQGDFSMPAAIHDRVPPGVETMKARRDAIRYAYAESPRGGVVTIATKDAQALEAVHAFLRFQIEDHATGDTIDR